MIQDFITFLLILGAFAWMAKGIYRIFRPGIEQRSCATGCSGCVARDQTRRRMLKVL